MSFRTGLLVLMLGLALEGYAQDKKEFKKTFLEAEYFFYSEEYAEAVMLYNELLKQDPLNGNLHFLMGACYLSLYGQKSQAIPYLEEAVSNINVAYRDGSYKERGAPREALFALARAYHVNYEFDLAIDHYEKYRNVMFKQNFADIEFVNNQIKSCELAKAMVKKPIEVRYLDMGTEINRSPSNYNPVFSYDDQSLIYMVDNPFYRAIMYTRREGDSWTEPVVINDQLGSEGDCFPTSLSMNGSELYLVRKDAYGLDIFVSRLKNGKWTEMEPLNKNINSEYSETHACISVNGRRLYFTSDRHGGQGAMDLFVSERDAGGEWGVAENMGPRINSFYSEETPFITENGKRLYFSSQGHATMGGYDIFFSELLPDGTWSFPENIGFPVSTADDDLFYVPRKNGARGYYSIIREGSGEKRSIFAISIGPPEEMQIAVRKQGEMIETGGESGELALVTRNESGEETGKDADKGTETATTIKTEKNRDKGKEKDKEQEQVESANATADEIVQPSPTGKAEGVAQPDPDQYYILNSILFGFDKYELNEAGIKEAGRILEVMSRHPDLKVELTGHTDARGEEAYNRQLSERRANSIAEYLIREGIEKERIRVTGAGEILPVAINQYEDGSDCPDGRTLNRHVSISLSNLQSDNVLVNNIMVPGHLKPKKDRSYSIMLIQSEEMLDTIPDEVFGEQTALIITDEAFLYTAGNFKQRPDAVKYLNEVIDRGYPDASMLEKDDLENLIATLSEKGIFVESTYTIQIMALSKAVPVSYFSKLTGVNKYEGQDGLHRYVYGEFDGIDQAIRELPGIKKMGYHDAFIMSILRYKKLAEE